MKKDHSFEKNSLIIFVLMQLANVCNYLFQIFTGNLMSVEDYAVLNTLVSLYALFCMPNTIISLICAKFFAEINSEEEKGAIIKTLMLLVEVVIALIVVVGVIITPLLGSGFGIDNYSYLIVVIAMSVVSIIYYLAYGILQGMQNFVRMGIQSFIASFLKFALTIVFLILGMRIFGALAGILIGTIIAMIYGIYPLRESVVEAFKTKKRKKIPNFVKFIIGNFIAQGCIIAYTNGDILLIKYYFDSSEAGVYSSAMVIGKIAMYVSTAVVATLFPMVITKKKLGESTKSLFLKALLYGGGASVICSVLMILLGDYVIGIMFGERYAQAVGYLSSVCIYVVPLTFNVILMNYLIALDKLKHFSISSLIGIVLILTSISLKHESIMQVMSIVGFVLTVVFVYNVVVLAIQSKEKKDAREK